MLKSIFKRDPSIAAGESLFALANEQSRQPALYRDLGVPDTVEGRFEMTSLHIWLVLRRLKGGEKAARKTSQHLFDAMFDSFDAALREMGVGDLVVGKKVRKLAENFYGRASAYEEALAGQTDALAAALARNVYEANEPSIADGLADYVRRAAAMLDDQSTSQLAAGNVKFPESVAR